MKKILALVMTLLVATIFAASVNAQSFQISKVEIDGVEYEDATDTNVVSVERGDTLDIRVELDANTENADDVKVKAWIGGYEYGDIEDVTSAFDVKSGRTYIKKLVLEIPSDLNLNDDNYELHVEAYNDDNDDEFVFGFESLGIDAKRHALNFVDVIFNSGLSVDNRQPLFVTARLENLGDRKEKDIKVEVSIPELGISQRTYIDELTNVEDSEDDDEETSRSSETLLLDLRNVKPGTYALKVKAEYNRGHSSIVKDYQLTVNGQEVGKPNVQEVIVQALSTSSDVDQSGSATYTFSIANLGKEAKTFSFEPVGYETWATSKLDPLALTVLPDSTRDVKLVLNAKQDAEAGNKVFTVRVKEGNAVVKELQFSANVKQPVVVNNVSSLRSGLEVGFIVLLAILVILGIILAINKMKGKNEDGESYY